MPCLQHLNLNISRISVEFPSRNSAPKDMVSLSKPTEFSYTGNSVFLEVLTAGLSAPTLRHVSIRFRNSILPPIVHLSRFINEIVEEQYYAVRVAIESWSPLTPNLSLFTQSEYIGHRYSRFHMGYSPHYYFPDSIWQMSRVLSTRLTTVEELRITFGEGLSCSSVNYTVNNIKWRRFLQHFPSVKAIRTQGGHSHSIPHIFIEDPEEPDDGAAFLPALKKIELENDNWSICMRQSNQRGRELADFQPFVSARQQAGRPVKVFFRT